VLVGLTVANVIIEEAVITDIALVSLFLAFFARVTITEAISTSGLETLYVWCGARMHAQRRWLSRTNCPTR
jgi:hypothetical protein